MKEKVWYEVKVTCDNPDLKRPMINETVAKVKSKGLAMHVKQKIEEIYKDAVVRVA